MLKEREERVMTLEQFSKDGRAFECESPDAAHDCASVE